MYLIDEIIGVALAVIVFMWFMLVFPLKKVSESVLSEISVSQCQIECGDFKVKKATLDYCTCDLGTKFIQK